MLEKKNYEINSKIVLPEGMLNGQGCGELAKMRYGLFSMGYNGCEMIALYNLMYLEGRAGDSLAEICLEMYPKSGVLWGIFGSDCFKLKKYFGKRGIPLNRYLKRDDFFEALPAAKYGIVTFWNSKNIFKGIHTVCVESLEGGGIRVYNRYNSKDYPYEYASPDEVVDSMRYICGYTLMK